MAASPSISSGIGRRLLADGLLTQEQAEEALSGAKRERQSFPLFLAQNAIVDGAAMAAAVADEFGSPLFDVSSFDMTLIDNELVSLVNMDNGENVYQFSDTYYYQKVERYLAVYNRKSLLDIPVGLQYQVSLNKLKLSMFGGLAFNVNAKLKRVSKGIQFDNKFVFDTFNEEELVKHYKSKVWNYNNNLEIEDVKLLADKKNIVFTEDLSISIKNFASINEQEYLFRVNVFNRESFVPKRYRTRKLPLKISRGYKDVDAYEFKLPKGYVLGVLPKEKNLTTKFGYYKVTFTKIDDTSFKYHKTILIKEGIYPKEDYKLYRSFRRSIAKYENLRIAITKKI